MFGEGIQHLSRSLQLCQNGNQPFNRGKREKVAGGQENVSVVCGFECLAYQDEFFVNNPLEKKNSVALVCKRTILTEQPPLGEVSANFCVVSTTDPPAIFLDF
jgi:hypothetical protein